MEIEDIKEIIVDPKDKDRLRVLLDFTDEIINAGEMVEREELQQFLAGFLSKNGQTIEQDDPDLYQEIQTKWLLLAFSELSFLEKSDQENLLSKKIFSAIQRGLDPDEIVKQYFARYESDEYVRELFRNYLEALDQNTETLGSLPIEVEGKRMLPNIKYWLLDYSKFPSKNARRGSVERLNYLTQSANVRQLTQGQRQNLSKLLKFYDDLIAGERPLNYQDHRDEKPLTTARVNIPVPHPINIDQKLDELKERVQK